MKNLQEVLPLTPLTYNVLLALADDERHGYAILKEIEERTGAEMTIETGALYHALKRMLDEGLIEAVSPEERPAGEDRRRRAYRLKVRMLSRKHGNQFSRISLLAKWTMHCLL